MSKKIGVLLSGCGYLDGAEIRESVCTILALEQNKAEVKFIAPNIPQHHVVDHFTAQEVSGQSGNVLHEAARIARGKIEPLNKINVADLDGLMIPGGYGVAKNFCSFAFKGHQAEVNPSIKHLIEQFHQQKKPIGALCIAPALLSLIFGKQGIRLTIGTDEMTAQEIEKTGAKHVKCQANGIIVDEKNKIVTSPAYMFDQAPLDQIFEGIQKCVQQVLAWT